MKRLCTLYRRFEHDGESFWIRVLPGLQPGYHLILAQHMRVRGFCGVKGGRRDGVKDGDICRKLKQKTKRDARRHGNWSRYENKNKNKSRSRTRRRFTGRTHFNRHSKCLSSA